MGSSRRQLLLACPACARARYCIPTESSSANRDAVPSRSTIAWSGGCSSPRHVARCMGPWHCASAARAVARAEAVVARPGRERLDLGGCASAMPASALGHPHRQCSLQTAPPLRLACRAKEGSGRRCPACAWQSQSRLRRRPTALPIQSLRVRCVGVVVDREQRFGGCGRQSSVAWLGGVWCVAAQGLWRDSFLRTMRPRWSSS